MARKLPIGIQSFEVIRSEDYYYVDKTPFVKKLAEEGKYYFLARPRRFGKSLFLDTLRQAFLGRREFFQGFERNDLEALREAFRAFFASIPYDWYRKSEIQNYEGYYASVFYAYFAALGLEVRVEEAVSHGRIDLAVVFGDRCYLFEFKVVELEGEGSQDRGLFLGTGRALKNGNL